MDTTPGWPLPPADWDSSKDICKDPTKKFYASDHIVTCCSSNLCNFIVFSSWHWSFKTWHLQLWSIKLQAHSDVVPAILALKKMSIYFYLPKLLCPRCNPKGCWRWWSSVSLEAANFQTRTSRLRKLTKHTHLRLEKPISLVSITHNAMISIATTGGWYCSWCFKFAVERHNGEKGFKNKQNPPRAPRAPQAPGVTPPQSRRPNIASAHTFKMSNNEC